MATTADERLTALRCRLKLVRTKALSSLIAVSPRPLSAIEFVSRLLAVLLFISRGRERKAILRGAGRLGLKQNARSLARRYFMHTARARVWAALIYDLKNLQEHVSVPDVDQLKSATAAGRGAILVGAHIGPAAYTYTLWRQGVIVRPLAGGGTWRRFHRFYAGAAPFLKTGKVEFIREMKPFPSHRSERALVRHVKSGGIALLLIDRLRPPGAGSPAHFLGGDLRFSHFPFKLALRYGIPLFFCYFKPGEIGFRLDLVEIDDIKTPAEGVERYAAFFEQVIRERPHLWQRLPAFCEAASSRQAAAD